MELSGTIKGRGALAGSFDFDQADYNLLKNKPSINGVDLVGNKTSEDLHINSGGGGGTNNYNDLENKPKINGVIIQDELTLHSLGIQEEIEYPEDSTKYLDGNGEFTTPPGYIPPDYSINETSLGYKWINGKELYRAIIEGNSQNWIDISNLDIDEIIIENAYFIIDTDQRYNFAINAGGNYIAYSQFAKDLNSYLLSVTGWTTKLRRSIIIYTKNN